MTGTMLSIIKDSLLMPILSWLYGIVHGVALKIAPPLPRGIVDFVEWGYGFLISPPILATLVFLVAAVIVLLVTFLNVIIMIWVERKFIARLMDRRGPTEVGFAGLLQNVADGIKLFTKEIILPRKADWWSYNICPVVYIGTSFALLVAIPISPRVYVANLDAGIIMVYALFSLAPFMIFIGGWASNNKFSLIGGMRSAAQMISYEIPLMLSVVGVVVLASSFNFTEIVAKQMDMTWFVLLQPLGFILFLTAVLAEVERIPFDLPEAEAELVEGWTTEYGGMRFGLIMFTEYIRGYAGCALATLLFLGGWNGPFLPASVWFFIKVYLLFMLFIWLRAALPRIRIDQLLNVSWRRLLPLALFNIFLAMLLIYMLSVWNVWLVCLISILISLLFVISIMGGGWVGSPKKKRVRA